MQIVSSTNGDFSLHTSEKIFVATSDACGISEYIHIALWQMTSFVSYTWISLNQIFKYSIAFLMIRDFTLITHIGDYGTEDERSRSFLVFTHRIAQLFSITLSNPEIRPVQPSIKASQIFPVLTLSCIIPISDYLPSSIT